MQNINPHPLILAPSLGGREVRKMYENGLGISILARFEDHQGFNGVILRTSSTPISPGIYPSPGRQKQAEHQHKITCSFFYIPDVNDWVETCNAMDRAGFEAVISYNPYWDQAGKTIEDIDGYRVVLQNRTWSL
jgi:hypothetical protein